MTNGISAGQSISRTLTPWYEYRKRQVVSNRQFLSKEEQMTLFLQAIKAQPKGHFLLKVPDHEAVFVRAPFPFIKDPVFLSARLNSALERIYTQPCYSTPEDIATEEEERARSSKSSYN